MYFDRVCAIIAQHLEVPAENIAMETHLIDDLNADSLDIVELIMDFESEFDVEIPDEELPKFQTVGDIVHFLEKR